MAIPVDFEIPAPGRSTKYLCRAVKLSDTQPFEPSVFDIDYECVDAVSKYTVRTNLRVRVTNIENVRIMNELKSALL